jgi:hypothetical protein
VQARREDGLAAQCLLAALGTRVSGEGLETARAYVGALYLLEAMAELKALRKAMTRPAT